MSGKASRISELWEGVDPRGRDVRYAAYFERFNREEYYEAHDVLESLWLEGGREAQGAKFYQGLIQLAGAFVHLKKHFEAPSHRVHGQRLPPAYRLFGLAEKNVGGYGEIWEGMMLAPVRRLAGEMREHLERGEFKSNPWRAKQGPKLDLPNHPRSGEKVSRPSS